MMEQLREVLGPRPDPSRRARQRARFLAEARTRRSFGLKELLAGAVAAALGSGVVLAVWQQHRQPAGLEAPRREGSAYVFNEASEVYLEPGARAHVEKASGREAVVVLESGELTVSITSGRKNLWRFKAGPHQVVVRGTKFSMLWRPKARSLDVQVREGQVEVHTADGQVRQVGAGERLSWATPAEAGAAADPELPAVEPGAEGPKVRGLSGAPSTPGFAAGLPAGAPPSTPGDRPALEPGRRAPEGEALPPSERRGPDDGRRAGPPARGAFAPERAVEPERPRAPDPERRALVSEWKRHAEAGRYAKAVALVEEQGVDGALAGVSSDDLLLFADAARLARRADLGRAALATLRQRFAGTGDAAEAAFRLGRLEFDQRHLSEAGAWFDAYVKEAPEGPFVTEAMGRRLDAWQRARDGRVGGAASEYLERFPKGAYAPLARQVLGEL